VKCRNSNNPLKKFLDGESSPADDRFVAAHLAECPACTMRHRDIFEIVSRLRRLPFVPPSAGFGDRVIKNALQANREQGRKKLTCFTIAASAIFLSLILLTSHS